MGYSYDNAGRLGSVQYTEAKDYQRFRWDYAYQSGSGGLVSQIQTAAEWKVVDSTTWWDSQPGAVSRVQAWETTRDVLDSVENLGAGNSTLSKYDYAVNNRGQRTQVVKTGSAFAANAFHAWGYDSKGQVTSANKYLGTNTGNTSQPVNAEHFGFNYDNIGNRNWASVAGNTTANYTAGLLNQYSSITSGNTTENPVHDADGNLIEDAGYLYSWDGENRLVEVEDKGSNQLWQYAYDAEGRRYWAGGGSVERFFVYDGWNVIRDRQVWTGGESSDYYVWGLDLSGTIHGAGGVGGLLMWLQPQSVGWNSELELRPHWYTYDGNGNVSDLVSGEWDFTNFLDPTFSSALENHYEYGAFGEVVATENRPENPFRFSTKWHEGNGLVYYGYRYYNPETGRWLNRDPIGERGGFNLFCATSNNLNNGVDPFGLQPWQEYGTISAAAKAAAGIVGNNDWDDREYSAALYEATRLSDSKVLYMHGDITAGESASENSRNLSTTHVKTQASGKIPDHIKKNYRCITSGSIHNHPYAKDGDGSSKDMEDYKRSGTQQGRPAFSGSKYDGKPPGADTPWDIERFNRNQSDRMGAVLQQTYFVVTNPDGRIWSYTPPGGRKGPKNDPYHPDYFNEVQR